MMKPFIVSIFLLLAVKLVSQTQPSARNIDLNSDTHNINQNIFCDGKQIVSIDTYVDGMYLGTDYAPPLTPTGFKTTLIPPTSTNAFQFYSLNATIDPYQIPTGESNAVITVEKSIQIAPGVTTPWKPTAFFPATRTSTTLLVLPGVYFFRATVTLDPMGTSAPTDPTTNTITIQ